ncbi:amino acid adenylation domain-containing protein [Methylobacter sp. Wu8]|uniref:non-ribosomal peptide synthetase n=1 Tax=Methylobacter sp. Wu8 TaxID=3118457 RepID=UPI002F2E271C
MIPATLTAIERIPLTVNGKVDREALLQLVGEAQVEVIKTPPSTSMEVLIAPIWSELLGQDVCREDNFFGLGGNSLLAVAMAHRLSKALAVSIPARYLYTAPTLAAFAARVDDTRIQYQNLTKSPEASDIATEGELEFWVAEQAGINTTPFIMPLIRKVQGNIPGLEKWNRAWAKLTERHESLRTQFVEDDQGTLRRVVTRIAQPGLEEITVSDLASANTLIRERQSRPIPLNVAPLWQGGLVHVGQTNETLFWLAMHHAVGDGVSFNILLDELALLLQDKELPPLVGSYAHSAARALSYLAGDEFKHDFSYWRNSLAALPETAFEDWSLDMPRLQTGKPGYHRLQICLPADITLGLKAIAQRYDSSMHALMLTLLALETRRRSQRRQFLIGTPADMRETTEEAGIIGYYVNMLPLIMDGDAGDSFETQLTGTQQVLAAALHHGRVPFARIYNDFRQQRPGYRHPSRYPLFDFAVNENPQARIDKADIGFRSLARFSEAIEYELVDVSPGQDMVFIHEILPGGELMLQLQVNSAVYLLETATAWFNSLRWWVEWLCADKGHARMPLPKLLPQESKLLAQNGYGRTVHRPNQRFHELFESVIDSMGADSSKRLAVMTPESRFSYLSVEEQANRLANALIQSGIKPGAVIGVLTGRSPQLPSTILGIWKAGAIYLPLSIDLPVERLCHMVNDAAVRQLIVLDGLDIPQAIAQVTPTHLRPEQLADFHSHRPSISGDAGDTAYIIYTSGSTGLPKGALIAHKSYVNMALGCGEILGINSDDRCLMFYSPSFDVSLSDIGVPLLFGATVCPVHDDLIDSPNQFMKFLNDTQITVADISPTYLRLFDSADFQYLRILVTGGEAPFPDDIVKYSKQISYFNAYGPTENTVTCALGQLTINHTRTPSCGLPLPNTSIHICDANGNLLPPGEIGELWLGGMGLANGYLGREDLTLASFVETPEGRRYRSGDIGRWLTRLPNSPGAVDEVQFMGRMDSQIKMNGIRIELGEIEHIVNGHPSVFQATVLADEIADKKQRLSAFIHLRNNRACPSDIEWRDYLSAHLPAATIPTSFIIVDSIPVNSSGKVDVASLRGLAHAQQNHTVSENPPQTPMEKRVAAIWCELLKLETVRKDDNFFALGGHSLVAIAAAHRLERDLNRPVAARELFAFPILSDFSRRIDVEDQAPAADFTPTDRATTGQLEFWVAEKIGKANRGLNLTFSVAEQDRKVAAEQWRQAWGELVGRHPALRTYFKEDADGQLLRQILPALDMELERQCLPDLSAARIHIANLQAMTIPMSSAPLWRAGLVFVEDTRQEVFWLALHHAVGDGLSIGILLDELSQLLAGEKLPALSGDYNHFAGRELAYLKDRAAADAEYWSETLDGLGNGDENTPQPFDEWPLDFSRPINSGDGKNKGGHFFRIALEAATAQKLKAFASRHGASLHALMMALVAMETSRRTGRPNFVMGTVGSTRELAEDSAVVNYFLNMLPIACRINRNDSVEQSMAAMQLGISRALQHERYPFAQICQDFRNRHAASNHPTRFPLFDLAVTENPGLGSVSERHIKLVPVNDSATKEMRYDLRPNPPPQDMVLIHEALADDGLGLYWYVDANLYEKDTALAWVNALLEWMRFIVSPERQAQTALPLLTAAEEKLLDSWQYGPSLPKPTGYLQDQFMRIAGQEPHSPALLLDQETQSYGQIDKQSNGLAQVLRRHGIGPGVAVGVLTERSTALPATVLAIWKAGGCYLPLSAELPGERLKFIAEDADINLLVALDGLAIPSELASYAFLRPETPAYESTAPINHGCRDTDPAYIIYTSGSTGEPKGVVITFEGYANFCLGMKLALSISPDDKLLQISSPSFDAWLHELGLAWFHGGALAPVVRRELDDIPGMLLKMQGLGITIATLSPSYLGLFGNAEFPGLRMLLTMGEPPVKANALHYAERLTYINGYGPSENSVGSCIGQITPQSTRMTAGRPLANTSAHILNKDRQPVPPGSAGTLWLGGRGLSPGYLNRPELTAESFVETPEGRFYNSGDLARWTQQGEIEILGRIDNQVKLRGQRIELEEIEHQIGLHPDVLQAAVVIHGMADGTPGLYGFVCLHPEASAIGNGEWRSFLAKKVPDYMIPSAIKAVPGIPVSLAGKVDRKRLIADYLDQDIDMIASNDSDVGRLTPPGNRVEKLIAEAWSEIFPGRTIYSEDNFFELGGHSLAAISVVNRLRLEFTCTINNLYEHPVLADFAKTCQPRREHIRDLLAKVKVDWQAYSDHLEANPNQRIDGLKAAQEQYCARNKKYSDIDLGPRKDYENILLTGATGYVGCYLLREMLKEGKRKITALVRGTDHAASRDRLHQVLAHYFGPKTGEELAYHPRLQVLSSDLSRPSLGLSQDQWTWLATRTQAIFHCAANVKHYGHYQEFHRDNINSVQNLLELAAYNLDAPMDFHLISTTSVVGKPPESGFKLFTEYDLPNPDLSDNYYIRTKQEAERLVLDARVKLSNASIYRVGNVVFATDDSNLQINLKDNAFFRLVAALIELGAVPKKVEALFCHVDLVARAVMLLAETQALSNETHHIEHSQETSLAEFISTAFPLVTCDFGMFIDHLLKALDKPEQQQAFYEVLDGFNLYGGQAPQVKAQHIELTSGRTNELLKRLGLAWTDTSSDGQLRFLREAALHFKN